VRRGGGEGGRRDLGAVEKRGRSKDTMFRRIVRSCDIQDDLLSSFLVARDANCLQREREGGSERSRAGRGREGMTSRALLERDSAPTIVATEKNPRP
jgi:hypothetical protein